MAPEAPSPAASTTLLPLLGGSRSRRGSLASVTSRKEIDKEALAQVLDDIHTSASKSEALTSFHDYDGGAGGVRSGPKELVSNGVSGLYNKLRQSVGGPYSTKRPESSASRESNKSGSFHSVSPAPSRFANGMTIKTPLPDTASVSTTSVSASPLVADFGNTGEKVDGSVAVPPPETKAASSATSTATLQTLDADPAISAYDYSPEAAPVKPQQNPLPQIETDRARTGVTLHSDDRSGSATKALARVLSQNDIPSTGNRLETVNDHTEHAIVDDDDESTTLNVVPSSGVPRSEMNTDPHSAPARVIDDTHRSERRPPMVHVGVSHLPGFDPSRASSPVPGEPSSSSSSQIAPRRPNLDPSPNLNGGLQRRRTGLKIQPVAQMPVHPIPLHFKRRVISKEFWMRDENAKVCFNCGESFSTFRRKHHCRTCGQIFDSKCTSIVPGRPFGQAGTLRLCKPCEDIILGSNDDSSDYSEDGAESVRTPIARRMTVEEERIPSNLDGNSNSLPRAGQVMAPSFGIPASRRNRQAKQRSAVIEFDAQPVLARPSSSRSLVSLSGRPRSSSHKRHHSRHQQLRGWEDRAPFHQDTNGDPVKRAALPAFHNDNIIDPDLAPYLSDEGSEEDMPQSLFSAINADPSASPGERERIGFSGLFTSAVKKSKSKLGDRATTASSVRGVKEDDVSGTPNKLMPKHSRRRNQSITSITLGRPSPRRSRSNNLLTTLETEMAEDRPVSPLDRSAAAAPSKVIRSSAMHGRGAPPVELNRASLDHVHKMLAQSLNDAKVENVAAWQRALIPILLQCTDDVEPDVQRGDDMDIRHYIKLKKIGGGRPGDTSYVSGIVFSKNVALKSMARSISHPRIAIVTFAIEYARHQAHFMSLEPVIAQEREYLHNLVGRIVALRPQLLLVQKNVSGLALRLLEEAGITVAFNIKESVLAAVARVTTTTMLKSVDKLAIDPSHLGHCGSFDVKTYQHQGLRRTYIVLSGCQPDLGCTIILRGADTKTLRIIKRITEFMCYVVYNLKLETYLMRDEFVSIPSSRPDQLEAHKGSTSKAEGRKAASLVDGEEGLASIFDEGLPSKYGQFEEETRSRILSASPFVVFMQPHMLTQLREQEQKLAISKQLRDQYAAADEEGDAEKDGAIEERFQLVRPEMVHTPASKDQPKAVRDYLHAVHSAQFDRTMATYDNQRKLWESFVATNANPFDPHSHQTIVLLHSTVSSITSAPCVGPELLGIGFYAGYNHVEPQFEEDCTLGQYIEDLCLSAGSNCKECNRKMYDHHRQYVHGYGQLSISVQRQPTRVRGLSNTILMWASCRVCQAETTIVPMSDNTWKYSFAKYLELTFWSSPLHPRAGVCTHDIHKDFLRCFGFQDLVVRVQYDPVEIYDVVVPKPIITWKVEADLTVKNEQYMNIVTRLTAFIESIKKRLSSINVDTLDEKEMMEAQEALGNLRTRADDDHRELLVKLQAKYGTSRYYELIPLNRALRFMDEKALAWDEAFNNFERDYFPSETDIRKLAAAQLKEMFYGSHSTTDSVTSDTSDNEGEPAVKPAPPKSVGQRIADEEFASDKAHDVLTSVAQEHRASRDETVIPPLKSEDSNGSNGSNGSPLTKTMSPREDQEHAVERDEVKHLDLAVAARSPDDSMLDERQDPDEQANQVSRSMHREGSSPEPFAIQPKPLSSGLLQRIEQIRNNRGSGGEDQAGPLPESKIPRLVELKKREAGFPPSPPPLMRAQSQPTHVPRRSADLANENIDAILNLPPPPESPTAERRIGERLGHLGSKMGNRLPPSMIPRSIPLKIPTQPENGISSSVSALAKHFEQMSREFEKERLRERRQRAAKSRQARANPLGSSRPVVEVYRNATEAVGERHVDAAEPPESTPSDVLEPIARQDQAPEATPMNSDEIRAVEELQTSIESSGTLHERSDMRNSSDTDAEAEGSDADTMPVSGRSRDHSNPLSHVSSSTLHSPSAQDLEFHPELSIPDHKKNVWFKMLADFWSKRSASGWANLEYPLHNTEHVFEDSDIIVREDEPTSVVALSLACTDYVAKVATFRSNPNNKNPKTRQHHAHSNSTASASFTEDETGSVNNGTDKQQNAIEASLLSDTGTHMKYSFAHGTVKASCKIFYAESFDALRRRCGVADRFVESLSRCLKFDSKGGKTKSLFLKTLDQRFIVKSLQEVELKAFTKFAPDYFAFMSHTLFHGVPSVIAKMFGLFQVTIKNPATGVDFSYYLLVMENLFYEHNPNRRFDLKGSMRNRKISPTGQPDEVLLDENLVETIFESPLFVREHARKLLQASVWNDTLWLCKQNVMDYSLMAGFDDESKTLVVGIIDCIRTYTWDKKLESWIKDRGKNKPTITSPKDYRNRFRVSMMQYVLQAPNCWHQFQVRMAGPRMLRDGEGEDGVA